MYIGDHRVGRPVKLIDTKYQRDNLINFSSAVALIPSKRHFVSQYEERKRESGSCRPFNRDVYEIGVAVDSKAVFRETR